MSDNTNSGKRSRVKVVVLVLIVLVLLASVGIVAFGLLGIDTDNLAAEKIDSEKELYLISFDNMTEVFVNPTYGNNIDQLGESWDDSAAAALEESGVEVPVRWPNPDAVGGSETVGDSETSGSSSVDTALTNLNSLTTLDNNDTMGSEDVFNIEITQMIDVKHIDNKFLKIVSDIRESDSKLKSTNTLKKVVKYSTSDPELIVDFATTLCTAPEDEAYMVSTLFNSLYTFVSYKGIQVLDALDTASAKTIVDAASGDHGDGSDQTNLGSSDTGVRKKEYILGTGETVTFMYTRKLVHMSTLVFTPDADEAEKIQAAKQRLLDDGATQATADATSFSNVFGTYEPREFTNVVRIYGIEVSKEGDPGAVELVDNLSLGGMGYWDVAYGCIGPFDSIDTNILDTKSYTELYKKLGLTDAKIDSIQYSTTYAQFSESLQGILESDGVTPVNIRIDIGYPGYSVVVDKESFKTPEQLSEFRDNVEKTFEIPSKTAPEDGIVGTRVSLDETDSELCINIELESKGF